MAVTHLICNATLFNSNKRLVLTIADLPARVSHLCTAACTPQDTVSAPLTMKREVVAAFIGTELLSMACNDDVMIYWYFGGMATDENSISHTSGLEG